MTEFAIIEMIHSERAKFRIKARFDANGVLIHPSHRSFIINSPYYNQKPQYATIFGMKIYTSFDIKHKEVVCMYLTEL